MAMEITWLGHGTFLFRLPSGQVILMDPWTDGNPAFPKGYQILFRSQFGLLEW